MGGFGVTELLIVLAIVLLIFGPKRLKNIGSDLGNAIKGFRKAVTDEEAEAAAKAQGDPNVIEGEVASQASQSQASQTEESHQQSAKQQSRV